MTECTQCDYDSKKDILNLIKVGNKVDVRVEKVLIPLSTRLICWLTGKTPYSTRAIVSFSPSKKRDV